MSATDIGVAFVGGVAPVDGVSGCPRPADSAISAASSPRATSDASAWRWVTGAIVVTDIAAVALACVLAWVGCRTAIGGWPRAGDDTVAVSALFAPIWVAALAHSNLYRNRVVRSRLDELNGIANSGCLALLLTAGTSVLLDLRPSRAWLLAATGVAVPLLLAERAAVRRALGGLRARGLLLRPVIVVGSRADEGAVTDLLNRNRSLGYRVVATFADVSSTSSPDQVGGIEDLEAALHASGARAVLFTNGAFDCASTAALTRALTQRGCDVEFLSAVSGIAADRLRIDLLDQHPVLRVEAVRANAGRLLAKRAFDVVGAASLLLVLSPLIAVTAIACAVADGRPVFFSQERVGRDGRPFRIHKYRTMVRDAEDRLEHLRASNGVDGALFKMADDPRVTPLGRLLRRFSVDELPQLWNVVKGDMSLVGPRPALPAERDLWGTEVHQRLRVRPGVTGMWQVSGRNHLSFEDYVRLDLFYVDNWSVLTDLAIVAKTVPVVFTGRGSL